MYSRFPRSSDHPIRLPDHYSGCAFSETESPHADPPPPHTQPSHEPPTPTSCIKGEITSIFGRSFNLFSGGLQFEELLLIGLIILLARSEQESDVILWLALLLFCK